MGKSKAKKPTLAQKRIIEASGLIWRDYLIIKEDARQMVLAHRSNGSTRTIYK